MNESRTNDPVSMDAETLEALRGSIAKWEGIVAGTMKDECSSNCPLCQKFNFSENPGMLRKDSCRGCPVMARTGHQFCDDSPYERYADMAEAIEDGDEDYSEEEMRRVAQEELDFLKSLLPPVTALKDLAP